MNITKIDIHRCVPNIKDLGQVAVVSVVFDYCFKVNDIRLMNGNKGYYLLFPTDDYNMGIAYPITNNSRVLILDSIISELEKQ